MTRGDRTATIRCEPMDSHYVRLLAIAPSLGDGLTGRELQEARRLAVAPVVTLAAGHWDADELRCAHTTCRVFGCMIADGLVAHELVLGDRSATHLLGRGDIIAPRVQPSTTLALTRLFSVAEDTRLVLLDPVFPAIARRWPSIVGALFVQAERQLERVAVQQLISQLPRAEQRVVALLWHLADHWGRAEGDGVVVPLTLGHEAIGRLAGGRRPTVSAALARLADRKLVVRLSNGTWRLAAESQTLLDDVPAPNPIPSVRLLGSSSGGLDTRPSR